MFFINLKSSPIKCGPGDASHPMSHVTCNTTLYTLPTHPHTTITAWSDGAVDKKLSTIMHPHQNILTQNTVNIDFPKKK